MSTRVSNQKATDIAEDLVEEILGLFEDEGFELWTDVVPAHRDMIVELLENKVIEVLSEYEVI